MAGEDEEQNQQEKVVVVVEEEQAEEVKLLSSYLGLSFSLFLAFLPTNSLSLIPTLQSQIRDLSLRLFHAEDQLKQMRSRRKEDSKANARVVEIFASHRNAWQAEEKRLLQQIDAVIEEMASLRAKVDDLQREKEDFQARIRVLEKEVGERDEMLGFMSRSGTVTDFLGEEEQSGGGGSRNCYIGEQAKVNFVYGQHLSHLQQQQGSNGGFSSDFLASASRFWTESANLWQDLHCESMEPLYHMKDFVAREFPWKTDGETTGIPSKLKLLEQELLNLEKVGTIDLSKAPMLMRKQAKRYQALAQKIDDLCRRMQASDPCEPTLSPEFQTQRQTEFLLEAFRLQQRAAETGQKLMAVHTEISKSYYGEDDLGAQAKFAIRRSFDSIKNNLKDVQRNLEIWLARIIGDLEGILARDGSRAREYYISGYPFVQ